MLLYKKLWIVIAINAFNLTYIFPMQTPTETTEQSQIEKTLKRLSDQIQYACNASNNTVLSANQAMALAHSSNGTAIRAFQKAKDALNLTNEVSTKTTQIQTLQANILQQAQTVETNLRSEFEHIKNALIEQGTKEGQRIMDLLQKENGRSLEEKIRIEKTKIQEKQARGIYEQTNKSMAQANVDATIGAEKERWRNIREIIGDSRLIIKIGLAILIIVLCSYIIKYGIPALMNYLTQPRVISETSKKGWFGWFIPQQNVDLTDLIFTPSLEKQLFDLLLRVQSAKMYNEALPNVLFYGPSGIGKTAFAKTLAYSSGLDYALTSGSEFAKITDLNTANNELRKLLNWANNNDKGLIVFIDEAESLFANRKLPTTSKTTQDFINTFLALISDQSQKNVMFIFATNHPYKLDDAILNRIGINIEFTLPTALEREKIISMYLAKFAQENKDAIVELDSEIMKLLSNYAANLEGFSPRAIKFIAEKMIINARRQNPRLLCHDSAQAVIEEALSSMQKTTLWEKERDIWTQERNAWARACTMQQQLNER
ncbi:MAG: AAA family ATPase [bacterium]